jgi:hypothetical protein
MQTRKNRSYLSRERHAGTAGRYRRAVGRRLRQVDVFRVGWMRSWGSRCRAALPNNSQRAHYGVNHLIGIHVGGNVPAAPLNHVDQEMLVVPSLPNFALRH